MHPLEDQEKRTTRNNQDEIDLLVLFGYVGRFFKKIGNGINYMFTSIIRNLVVVAVITLAGMAAGFGLYKSTKPYYTSSMTLVLAEIRNQFVENQLSRLSIMIEEGNYEAVAEELEVGLEAARHIKEMSFFNLDENIIAEDSVLTGSPFEIELALYNNVLFPSMEVAIANYLESNRYFSKQKLIKQREMESMIQKLKIDIAAMDSVKKAVVSPRGPVNGFVYGQPLDPANLFRESILMYQQQVELEGSLEQLDNIQIVNGFAPRLRPTGPKLLKQVVIGGALAFIIGVIVALSLEKKNQRRKLAQ